MFVIVSVLVVVAPTATLPKLKLVGEVPMLPPEMPVPISGTLTAASESPGVTVSVPAEPPVAVGLKTT